jgi:hypothetical protein
MNGSANIGLANHPGIAGLDISRCQVLFSTEDPPFAVDPMPPAVEKNEHGLRIGFARPSAVLLSVWPVYKAPT